MVRSLDIERIIFLILVIQVKKAFTHDCFLAHIFKKYAAAVYITYFLLYIYTNVSRNTITSAS